MESVQTQKLFTVLPERFFSPLASANRMYYADALLVYYARFTRSALGVEKSAWLDDLEQHFSQLGGFEDESDDGSDDGSEDPDGEGATGDSAGSRAIANRVARKLLDAGWIYEEITTDYVRLLNMPSYARPYFDALWATVSGQGEEYESHIVAVYSLLFSDATLTDGHHTILKAHEHTLRLVDSLKLLGQNIHRHYELVYGQRNQISDILRLHYNDYLEEIIDRAYQRLKTSDNLSRYRPPVIARLNQLLDDEDWLQQTAARLAVIRVIDGEPRAVLVRIIEEVRDNLRSLDPIIDDIDNRNRQYSRISTEKIRALLHADASLPGRLQNLIAALASGRGEAVMVQHDLHPLRHVSEESPFNRRRDDGRETSVLLEPPAADSVLEALEQEIRLRIGSQMNPGRVGEFLDGVCASEGYTPAVELLRTVDDYVRLMYAAVYIESGLRGLPWRIVWQDGQRAQRSGYDIPAHEYVRDADSEKNHD